MLFLGLQSEKMRAIFMNINVLDYFSIKLNPSTPNMWLLILPSS